MRNRLAHENFASFPVEQSVEDIYTLYKKAFKFVRQWSNELAD
ncbi:hypothetical protein OMAG_002480, partial [Candidatus Omnitrophus magneticus]